MRDRVSTWFWAVGVAQAAHSVEEIAGELPASAARVTGPFAPLAASLTAVLGDPERFAVANLAIVAALLAAVPWVEGTRRFRRTLGVVGVVELVNGVAHPVGGLLLGAYVPGAVTGPLLAASAGLLLRELWRARRRVEGAPGVGC